MNCDNFLHPKLEKYELTKCGLNCHSTNLFIGKPRSGKTSLLYSLFQSSKMLKKVFHNIYLFQPSHSRSSMKDKLFDVLDEENKIEEMTYENLLDVKERIQNTDEEENNCIIIDDMTAHLKDNDIVKLLKELVFNRRHLHVSIYFLCQTWYSIPKDIRKLFSNIFVFKVSKNELQTIFDETVEDREKTDNIDGVRKLVYDEPFQYLFINTDSGRLFRGFDELLIE